MLDAAGRGVGQEIAFAVGPIEMEFAVELRADAKAKAGFKAWVLASAEVEAGVARGRTHRVKVTLTPKRRDGGDLLITADAEGPAGPGDVSGHVGR
ncbi:MAG TPA: trypco2 family protein [Actinomycetota bacterium]|nr:trypco2 family protein [Actinomycetota bacterium]